MDLDLLPYIKVILDGSKTKYKKQPIFFLIQGYQGLIN